MNSLHIYAAAVRRAADGYGYEMRYQLRAAADLLDSLDEPGVDEIIKGLEWVAPVAIPDDFEVRRNAGQMRCCADAARILRRLTEPTVPPSIVERTVTYRAEDGAAPICYHCDEPITEGKIIYEACGRPLHDGDGWPNGCVRALQAKIRSLTPHGGGSSGVSEKTQATQINSDAAADGETRCAHGWTEGQATFNHDMPGAGVGHTEDDWLRCALAAALKREAYLRKEAQAFEDHVSASLAGILTQIREIKARASE